jgi:hypothetical protein
VPEYVDFELYYSTFYDDLTTMEPMAEAGAERYDTGWLWDMDLGGCGPVSCVWNDEL